MDQMARLCGVADLGGILSPRPLPHAAELHRAGADLAAAAATAGAAAAEGFECCTARAAALFDAEPGLLRRAQRLRQLAGEGRRRSAGMVSYMTRVGCMLPAVAYMAMSFVTTSIVHNKHVCSLW